VVGAYVLTRFLDFYDWWGVIWGGGPGADGPCPLPQSISSSP